MKIPFTAQQAEAINAFQRCRKYHPFTCGGLNCREVLIAHEDGMYCPKCDYVQDWVHDFMADPRHLTHEARR